MFSYNEFRSPTPHQARLKFLPSTKLSKRAKKRPVINETVQIEICKMFAKEASKEYIVPESC
jgi:hypothetical protein